MNEMTFKEEIYPDTKSEGVVRKVWENHSAIR